MITSATRLHFGIAVFAVLAGVGYAFGSDFELYGIVVLATAAAVAVLLGVVAVGQRDGNVAPGEGADLAPGPMPTQPSPWPILGAIGFGLLALGVPAGVGYMAVGAGIVFVAAIEAAVTSWSERISADPAHNMVERDRVMLPLEIPVGVALVGATIALALSRVLLAVSATGAVVVAGVVATVILIIGSVIALRPSLPRAAIQGVAVLAAVGVLGAGVGGIVAGEREFHAHAEEGHGDEGDDHGDEKPPAGDDHGDEGDDHGDEGDDHGDEGDEGAAGITVTADDPAFTIVGEDIRFFTADGDDVEVIAVPAATDVAVTFENDERLPHNFAVRDGGDELFGTEIESGPVTQELTINLPAGRYTFVCVVHPGTMAGELVAA